MKKRIGLIAFLVVLIGASVLGCRGRVPIRFPIRAPVRAPVRAPLEVPVRAPVRPPVREPVEVPLRKPAEVKLPPAGAPREVPETPIGRPPVSEQIAPETPASTARSPTTDESASLAQRAPRLAEMEALGREANWRRIETQIQEERRISDLPPGFKCDLFRLELQVHQQQSLEVLERLLAQPWSQRTDVAGLDRRVADLLDATGDARLTTRVQRLLARKAFEAGFQSEAERLLPPGRTLRDLKPVDPPTRGSPGSPSGGAPGKPPRAAAPPEPPIPEAGPDSVRPAPRGKAGADLPPLGDDDAFGDQADESARKTEADLHAKVVSGRHGIDVHVHLLHEQSLAAHNPENPDKERRQPAPEAAVERLLGRKLAPAERILLQQMHRHGKNPAEIAAILKQPASAH